MSTVSLKDTICALATPWGEGGIGVIRVSGERAFELCKPLFYPTAKTFSWDTVRSHTMHHGRIIVNGSVCDEVMIGVYRAPRSYTSENVVEINAHGSIVVLKCILDALVESGVRIAEPGEFTKRAFLNGKMDLTQAEAVIDIITAGTERSAHAALEHLGGKLSDIVRELKERLLKVLAHTEAFLDFPEEDIELFKNPLIADELEAVRAVCVQLLKTYTHGALMHNGVHTVLAGKPNVGKSSLLNTLLNRDRAIVSDIPGTTRDTLEELLDVQGMLFRIVDTAGITETKDHVERMGIERTKKQYERADLILYIVDASVPLDDRDHELSRDICEKNVVVVSNKSDKPRCVARPDIMGLLGKECPYVETSLETKQGIKELEDLMVKTMWQDPPQENEVLLTRVRHKNALEKTKHHIDEALCLYQEKKALELLSCEMRDALSELRSLIGEVYSDDILSVIFSEFCIGK